MIDKTVLELVDRLIATSNRAAVAERDLEAAKKALGNDIVEIDSLKAQISDLNNTIAQLKDDIKSKNDSVSFWYKRANDGDAELKAEKDALAKEVEQLRAKLNTSEGLEANDRGLL